MLNLDLIVVRVKFVCNDGGEACEWPLTELDMFAKDGDRAVGRDADECVGGEFARVSALGGEGLPRDRARVETKADDETCAYNRRAFEKSTSAGRLFHQRHD